MLMVMARRSRMPHAYVTDFSYDALNRLISEADPLGKYSTMLTLWDGQARLMERGPAPRGGGANGAATTNYEYDED